MIHERRFHVGRKLNFTLKEASPSGTGLVDTRGGDRGPRRGRVSRANDLTRQVVDGRAEEASENRVVVAEGGDQRLGVF